MPKMPAIPAPRTWNPTNSSLPRSRIAKSARTATYESSPSSFRFEEASRAVSPKGYSRGSKAQWLNSQAQPILRGFNASLILLSRIIHRVLLQPGFARSK